MYGTALFISDILYLSQLFKKQSKSIEKEKKEFDLMIIELILCKFFSAPSSSITSGRLFSKARDSFDR